MQDFLQITTILLAVLALGISKRRVQKGFTSLSDTEKKYYHSQFKRIRLVQYSVVFLVVISSILITGGHLSGENSYFVFTLSFAALIFGSFYTYRLIRKESHSENLPADFLKAFLQDRFVLFILIFFMIFNSFLKLKIYSLIYKVF